MKAVVKACLPQAALNLADDVRTRRGLARVPRAAFRAERLAAGDPARLEAILGGAETARAWEADRAAIAGVLGDENRGAGVNPGDRRAIHALVAGLRPHDVLEIGTNVGASTLCIARALKGLGAGRVTTVDIADVNDARAPWAECAMGAPPRANVEALGCGELVTFVKAPAQEFMRGARGAAGTYDFVFLDGDHAAAAVYAELALALEVLAPGGVVLLHDYYPGGRALFPDGVVIHGPFRALERAGRECAAIRVQPLGALPWPTKQGSHMTSLALVAVRND